VRPSTAIVVVIPLFLLSGLFVLVATRGAGAADGEGRMFWDEHVAAFIRDRVRSTYVDEIDPERAERAFHAAMDAYLRELDEYCDYIPQTEHRVWKEATAGEYAGVGVKVERKPEGLRIVGVLPSGPAAEAGIAVDDVILAADGRPLGTDQDPEDGMTALLKGPAGSPVRLTVSRGQDGERRDVVVRRAVVRPPTTFSRRMGRNGEFGVIRIAEFVEATTDEVNAALDQMLGSGAKGIVIDLRRNGGGVLGTAVELADRFLSRGVIVRMQGRARDATREHVARAEPTDVPESIPVVVLINASSASASEVVAGALQDHRRALLVGERTYGKFLVQQITEIEGREAAVQLTWSRYYTPSGRSYQRTPGADPDALEPSGLLPDVIVELADEERKRLAQQWVNEEGRPWGEEPRHPEVAADWADPQLQRALDILEGRLVLQKIRSSSK
jgi:carboxyl-terminal processing protease